MDVLAFCLVLLLLTAYIARPLYERRTQAPADPAEAEGQARHGAIVRALSDLEIDRESGAVDPRTYDEERAALEHESTAGGSGGAAPPNERND